MTPVSSHILLRNGILTHILNISKIFINIKVMSLSIYRTDATSRQKNRTRISKKFSITNYSTRRDRFPVVSSYNRQKTHMELTDQRLLTLSNYTYYVKFAAKTRGYLSTKILQTSKHWLFFINKLHNNNSSKVSIRRKFVLHRRKNHK